MINEIKKNRLIYLAAFFLPALVILVAYFALGIEPFGDESVLVLDLNGQYVYYFENLRDAFWGDGSFLSSFSRNLSGEMVGTFAYYLASPFTIIIMLFPRAYITEGLLVMQLVKAGCAGVSFAWYLKKSRGLKSSHTVIFAVMYACMAYMIVQLMNPMWLDGLIYLPLICYSIERLIDKGKMTSFALILALMFISNFYIGWMIAIFCVLYFLGYYFFLSEKTPETPFSHLVFSGLKFAGGGMLAAGISAFLLLPLYSSLSLGKLEFTKPSYTFKTNFEMLDFFKNVLPNVYDTCRPEGSPVVYCGVAALLLVPLFFMNTDIPLRRKIGYGLLTLIILISMYTSTIDLFWHGLQVPNWLPYRYSFLFSFLMILMAADAFAHLSGISGKNIGAVFFGIVLFVFWVDKQKYTDVTELAAIWYTLLFAGIYGLILLNVKKSGYAKFAVILFTVFTAVEFIASSTYNMYQIDNDVVYSNRSSYNRYITLGRNTTEKLKALDNSPFYRVERNFKRAVNDAMAFGTFGISHSSSLLNAHVLDLLQKVGYGFGGHYAEYNGETYITDAIFGIKYVMEKGQAAQVSAKENNEEYKEGDAPILKPSKHYPENLVLANGDDTEVFYVYENPYALPLAFVADNDILNVRLSSSNPFDSQNEIFSSLISDEYRYFFKKLEVGDPIIENLSRSNYGAHQKYVKATEGVNSQLEYLFTPETNDIIYCFFPAVYERQVNLWLDKDFLNYYFEYGKKSIQTLGRFEPGTEHSLIMTVTEEKKEVLFSDEQFYYLDDALFKEAINTLKAGGMEIESFSETHIKGSVNSPKDGILFTSLAYEPGWEIYIDGVLTEQVPLLSDALIGVPITKGLHTVEMKFFPHYLNYGILISIFSALAVLMIFIYERKRARDELLEAAELNAISVADGEYSIDETETENADAIENETETADDNATKIKVKIKFKNLTETESEKETENEKEPETESEDLENNETSE
jgi:uncharacterized membrane protein YfhO